MRLLRADTEGLEFEDVPDGTKQYAILSHRWLLAHEEVKYADIVSNKNIDDLRQLQGWAKLDWCRQQAMEDGFKYVWADTACIDKSSSQELTESINSMYRWYQGAQVCYVYLNDMPDPLPVLQRTNEEMSPRNIIDDDSTLFYPMPYQDIHMPLSTQSGLHTASDHEPSTTLPFEDEPMPNECTPLLQRNDDPSRLEASLDDDGGSVHCRSVCHAHRPSELLRPWSFSSFEQSEWFTRAWTLQEMVASSKLMFYNRSWIPIGTLSDLAADVAYITGVHGALLTKQRSLDYYSIAQKMSWASMRQSTKIEDRAYSLIGLMNVSMGIVYGEGERAFVRLQEELLRVSSDDSIFAFRPLVQEAERNQQLAFASRITVTASALLAESPEAFRHCGQITHTRWQRDVNQYQPMVKDVVFRIRARTHPRSTEAVYVSAPASLVRLDRTKIIHRQAILNCALENKPLTIMKLNLFAVANRPDTFYVAKEYGLTLGNLRDECNTKYSYKEFSVVRDPGTDSAEMRRTPLLCVRKSDTLSLDLRDASVPDSWSAPDEAFLISSEYLEADMDILVNGLRDCTLRISKETNDFYVALESGVHLHRMTMSLTPFLALPFSQAFEAHLHWAPWGKTYHCSIKRTRTGFIIAKAYLHRKYLGHLNAPVVEINHINLVIFALFALYRIILLALTICSNFVLFVLLVSVGVGQLVMLPIFAAISGYVWLMWSYLILLAVLFSVLFIINGLDSHERAKEIYLFREFSSRQF